MTLLVVAALALVRPPSADAVIRQAQVHAKREGKNVLVKFEASWCSWCRRFNKLLDSERFGPDFRSSYVIASIRIRERDEKRVLENPGWRRTLRRLRHAPERDVPYVVILSPAGKKLGGSFKPSRGKIPDNGGYPQKPAEIATFVNLIARTGRTFSAEDRRALREFLQIKIPSQKR